MFSVIRKIVSFFVFTSLKITIAFTSNMHSMVLDVCGIIADTFRSHARYELIPSQNIPQIDFTTQTNPDILNVSVCTQTEERFTQSTSEKNSSTDVFIYNLDTSKRVTITHKDLNSSFTKARYNKYGTCKSAGKRLLRRVKSDRAVQRFHSNSSARSGRYKQESESSNMSIENDVTNAEIMHYSPNTTFTKDKSIHDRFRQSSASTHFENDQEKEYFSVVDEWNEFEHLDENKPPVTIYDDDEESISDKQKTSSPIEKLSRQSDPYARLGDLSRNQENDKDMENCDTSSDTSGELQPLDEDRFDSKSFPNILDNTVLLNDSVKRRLSLSSSFSTANEAANFRKIQNKIIENAIKSTPRQEKGVKVIKYPFSPETSLVSRADEEKENSKEMFSCSSYESLPFSDHIRNAFEKSTFFSLYKESFISTSLPDFSSVDDFVEAFQKIKKALSLSEIVETRANFSFPEDPRNEVKRLLRAHSCCIIGTQQNKTNENNEMTYEDEQASNGIYSERSKPAATNVVESDRPERKCSISPSSLKVLATASTSFDLDKYVAEQIKILFDEIVENIDSHDQFKIREEFNGTDNIESDFDFTLKNPHLGPSDNKEYELNSVEQDAENWKQQSLNVEDNESCDFSGNQKITKNKTKPIIVSKTKQSSISAHCKAEKETANENKSEMNCFGRHRAYERKSFKGSRNTETHRNRIRTELSNTNQSTDISKSKTPNDFLSVASKSSSEMLFIANPEMEESKHSQSDQLPSAENDGGSTLLGRPSMTHEEGTTGREKLRSCKCGVEQRSDTQSENNVEHDILENEQLSTFLVNEHASCEDTSSDNSVLTVKDLEVTDERSSDTSEAKLLEV